MDHAECQTITTVYHEVGRVGGGAGIASWCGSFLHSRFTPAPSRRGFTIISPPCPHAPAIATAEWKSHAASATPSGVEQISEHFHHRTTDGEWQRRRRFGTYPVATLQRYCLARLIESAGALAYPIQDVCNNFHRFCFSLFSWGECLPELRWQVLVDIFLQKICLS
jgi:hypothetical protein